jgi:pyruvate/2-oxoglutarate dehydrogenase complex dihydrolipoamide dehydrogenase (E3) component
MVQERRADLCVIGAGSGGLSVAAGAAQLGADTVLIEAGRMGGDCLNVGCVPSKSLLAAGHAAHAAANGMAFGVRPQAWPAIDAAAVRRHVQDVIDAIAPHDSQERFEGLGVTVRRTTARFVDPETVEADGERIRARRFVIATGSRPAVPPIPGIESVGHLTNETIWDLADIPEHLVVIGGGPIGIELAQAHRRLGARVTVLEAERMLSRDDAELVGFVRDALTAEGVAIREGVRVIEVAPAGNGMRVTFEDVDGAHDVEGSHLLVATGRAPNVEALELDKAGIAATRVGVTVDRRLRTTNRRVFAVGDVTGGPQFTHVAGHHASVVVQNALFRLPAKVSDVIPAVTYTDPELASVGPPVAEAAAGAGCELVRVPYADSDRARAERRTEGLLKLAADRRGRVKAVAIAGAQAGELLQPWLLAMTTGIKLRAMASLVAPYPTLGELNKKAASAFYAPRLFSPGARRLVRWLGRLG